MLIKSETLLCVHTHNDMYYSIYLCKILHHSNTHFCACCSFHLTITHESLSQTNSSAMGPCLFLFLNPHPSISFHCFSRERGGERNIDARVKHDQLSPVHTWTGNRTCYALVTAQATKPHQPGLMSVFLRLVFSTILLLLDIYHLQFGAVKVMLQQTPLYLNLHQLAFFLYVCGTDF